MQSYIESTFHYLIRPLHLMLLPILAISVVANASTRDTDVSAEIDTLVARWSRSNKSLPFIAYHVDDTVKLGVQAKLIRSHGFGAVAFSGGEEAKVKTLINDLKERASLEPVFIARIREPFVLPFRAADHWPSAIEIQCASDTLAYHLGHLHGMKLIETGIDMVEPVGDGFFGAKADWPKISAYILGLREAGLFFSVFEEHQKMIDALGWNDILFYRDLREGKGKKTAKIRRQFKRSVGYDGIFTQSIGSLQGDIEDALKEGISVITCDYRSVQRLELSEKSFKKTYVGNAVRAYFQIWKRVKRNVPESVPLMDKDELIRAITEVTTVVVKNKSGDLPIAGLSGKSFLTLLPTEKAQNLVDRYKRARHLNWDLLDLGFDSLGISVDSTDYLLADISGLSVEQLGTLLSLQDRVKLVAFFTGNVDSLEQMLEFDHLIWSPREGELELLRLIQTVFGAEAAFGTLPVDMRATHGLQSHVILPNGRLKYHNLQTKDIELSRLDKIETIVHEAIRNEELPGCQIMMIKDGEVVYDKNFGFLTYDSVDHVQWDHIYDMASVTKTSATLPLLMHSYDRGHFKLDSGIGDYLTAFEKTDKAGLTIEKILRHESGLKSYYPFWRLAKYDVDSNTYWFKKRRSGWRARYDYLKISWLDSMNARIARSQMNSLINADSTFRYLYSDLGFMLLAQMIEGQLKSKLDVLTDSLIVNPLGLDFTSFNPKIKFPYGQFAPTEDDGFFRKRLLVGEVHDKNAALLGGVSGHAGLFSNANDQAKYMQMILQHGYYGGEQFLDSATVSLFYTKPEGSYRRALGWDKPSRSVQNASKYASNSSFGHSGFSGTLVWGDPEYNMIYVFISNRIHPDPQNYKLIERNTRTRIQDVMYESILSIDNVDGEGL